MPAGFELLENLPGALLVRRVGVGVEEGDDDGLHSLFSDGLCDIRQLGVVEWPQHLAGGGHPLVDLPAPVTLYQRLVDPGQAIHLRTVAPAELEHVSEAAGGDQRTTSPATFDQGIGRDGCAVKDRRQ